MNKDACPGPDSIPMRLLAKADINVLQQLTSIFDASLKLGYYPKPWKLDNSIYVKKPGKDSYHTEKAYRRLSLTNTMGKLYERILMNRITRKLEETDFFKNKGLYAYRKNQNTTHALLHLVEDMSNAINNNKIGAAVMADLEGAFDAIWRNGIVFKLANAHITGRLLLICNSFLHDRFSRNLVNSHVSEWIQTHIGVPQGSLLSVIFFLVYTNDLSAKPSNLPPPNPQDPEEEMKYADDFTLWVKADNITQLQQQIKSKCEVFLNWCNQWRLSINPTKTEAIIF